MIRLYLIRHGETDWNKERRFQGWTDLELNSSGISQATALGERFKNTKIDEVLTNQQILDSLEIDQTSSNYELMTNIFSVLILSIYSNTEKRLAEKILDTQFK